MKKMLNFIIFALPILQIYASDKPSFIIDQYSEKIAQLFSTNKMPKNFNFTNEPVSFSGIVELKTMRFNAQDTDMFISSEKELSDPELDTTFIGNNDHKSKIVFTGTNEHRFLFAINNNTEFRRLPFHNLEIIKKPTISAVQWTIVNNQRVLFSPVGNRAITLPEDTISRTFSGATIVDEDINLEGLCLVDGLCAFLADTQDVHIRLNNPVTLMNANDTNQSVLFLGANVGQTLYVHIDYPLQFRSHLDTPFYVLPIGPGTVKFIIQHAANN
ncbi:hypothetical protein IPH25_00480 [bacterium]|nr:MAG: hypothetical protein IPG37_02595 [bacterium]QQR61910.1 MAG: hypothetical protein IPH25_00480 [bacterium]